MRDAPAAPEPLATADLASLAVLDRYFSIPLVFALLAAASFLIAWNRGMALMYAVFALFVAASAFCALAPRRMVRRARVRLGLPREARVGDVVPVTVEVEPQRAPVRRHFVRLEAPFPFAPGRDVFLSHCGRGEVHETRVTMRRRGVFSLDAARAASGYPIGLVTARREWAVEPAQVIVFPRVHPVTRFALAAATARLQGEVERPSASVGQELFREVREYRSGDNPRHIHWRSSAHHGELIVKQFETIATSESWIVLDLDRGAHAGEGEDHSFERAVEIAATIATHLSRSGVRCGIAGGLQEDGSFALWHPPGTGAAHLDGLLYALTAVEADGTVHYPQVLAALARHHRRGQQWILFDHGAKRAAAPRAVAANAMWFRFDNASFEDPARVQGEKHPPTRLADGFEVAVDTDIGAIFR